MSFSPVDCGVSITPKRNGTTGCGNSLARTDRPASDPASRFPEAVAAVDFEVAFVLDLGVPDLVRSGHASSCGNQIAHTHDNLGEVDVVVGMANESPSGIQAYHKRNILAPPPQLVLRQVSADLSKHFDSDLDLGTQFPDLVPDFVVAVGLEADLAVGTVLVIDIDLVVGTDLVVGPVVGTDLVIDNDLAMGIDLEGSTHDLCSRNPGHDLGHYCCTIDCVEAHTSAIHCPKTWDAGLDSIDLSLAAYSPSLGRGHSLGVFRSGPGARHDRVRRDMHVACVFSHAFSCTWRRRDEEVGKTFTFCE